MLICLIIQQHLLISVLTTFMRIMVVQLNSTDEEEDGMYSTNNASEDDSTSTKYQENIDASSAASRGFSQELTALEIPHNTDLFEKLMSENLIRAESKFHLESPTDDPMQHSSISNEEKEKEKEKKEEEDVPKECISQRIYQHKESKSFQLGNQLSCNWSSGAGPRIGCLRDYPWPLQERALEQVKLSPQSIQRLRLDSSPSSELRRASSILSCRTSFHSRTRSSPLHSLC